MKKYIKKLLFLFVIMVFDLFLFINYSNKSNYEQTQLQVKLSKLDLKSINKLMIITHPDDETLWGGAQLIDYDYLVICLTCGSNEVRNDEFKKVMSKVNCPYISLSYPDKTNGKRDDWNNSYPSIKRDIKDIVNYKDWGKIVTHNPEGEYGHEQHIITSNIVTNFSNKENLYYFNDYILEKEYSKSGELEKLDEGILEKKKDLLKIYKSQTAIINNHYHTIIYKELTPYKVWKHNNKKYVCNMKGI